MRAAFPRAVTVHRVTNAMAERTHFDDAAPDPFRSCPRSGALMPKPRGGPSRPGEDRDRDRDAPSFRPQRRNTSAEVLALRESDHSFVSIASSLGMKRASEAHEGFLKAVREMPDDQRAEAVKRESARLDRLEQRIRSRDASDPSKMARRLAGLQTMRDRLG